MLIFPAQSRIVFMGDSVTDAGRDRSAFPGGWGYGQGYVNHIHNLLTAVYPDRRLCTINSGVSGDDIMLMAKRWQTDVVDFDPQYVSVLIGVNDAWRYFDGPLWQSPLHTAEEYESVYDDLLARTVSKCPHLRGLIVMSPFMFERNPQEAMRSKLEEFREASERVARRHQAVLVDPQKDIDRFLARLHTSLVSPDRVHPNERGAMIVARSWLRSVGFDWERNEYDD